MIYTINHRFTSLNQYISAERRNRYIAAKIKKEETNIAYTQLLGKPPITTPCKLKFTWYIKNKRTDADNICFARKFILDGMIKAELIPDDNMKHIIGFTDEFIIDVNERVEIEVYE
jgi:Holliday junction resolvase RusA-like endonuclease